MRILPVLDLMNGHVVRGVAGQRHNYKPIVSRLTSATDPVGVALAFREHFGLNDLYVADLDAIAGGMTTSNLAIYAALRKSGFQLAVDAGIRAIGDAEILAAAGIDRVVVGLESLRQPESLPEIAERLSGARVVFSVDLKGRMPQVASPSWQAADGWGIACQVVRMGVRQLLILDVAAVGIDRGPSTLPLCARLRAEFPNITLLTGGGIRGREDLRRLGEAGVHEALIASALHDGRLTREMLAAL
jgi:phosphoribosylformimino-5-aminoimidazole carboxamide ribotide isomerase